LSCLPTVFHRSLTSTCPPSSNFIPTTCPPVRLLPPTLVFIYLLYSQTSPELAHLDLERADPVHFDCPLPSTLHYLDIGSCKTTNLQLHDLSPTMTHLNIGSREISSAALLTLPPLLTYLNVHAGSLKDTDIKNLPRGLKALIFNSGRGITDVSIPDFPTGLESLEAPGTSISTTTGDGFSPNMNILLLPRIKRLKQYILLECSVGH